jgi:hypothetical protein
VKRARCTAPRRSSWSFRSVLASYEDTAGRPYALSTRTLSNGVATTLRLNGGSAAYLRYALPAGRQATLRTRTTGTVTGGNVRLAVVRTR